MRIEFMPVVALRPFANNARRHSKAQLRQIAESIRRFGFCNPVLIDDRDQIVAGHGRVEAAKLLKMDTVPTCRLSHLSEAEKRAYVIADNKIASAAGWDKELLAIELQSLLELDVDLALTGFAPAEIDRLFAEDAAPARLASRPEDALPPVSIGPAVSRPGDLWRLDGHALLCGNAADPPSYHQLLAGEKAEFVFTGLHHPRDCAGSDTTTAAAARPELLQSTLACLVENTVAGSIHQICADWCLMEELLTAGRMAYSQLINLCVWTGASAAMGNIYDQRHELIFVWQSGSRTSSHRFEPGRRRRRRSNVWNYPGVDAVVPRDAKHKAPRDPKPMTIRPVALVADAIEGCCRRGGLVLDPFGGLGTSLIAAERSGRKARLLEINPGHVDVAVRRWQAYTGKSAILAGTDQTFASVEPRRHMNAAAE